MEAAKDNTLHPSVSLFSGILLALFVFSLALMQVILLFGEGRNITSTSQGGLILSILSVVAYATGEITLFPRARRKTLFALSYFMTFSLLAMLFFHFVTTCKFQTVSRTLWFRNETDFASNPPDYQKTKLEPPPRALSP